MNWVASDDEDHTDDALYFSYTHTSGIAPSKTYFNKSGQVRRIVTQGYKDNQVIYTDREYYDDGRIKQESLPYFSETNEVDIQWNKYDYEAAYNRLSKIRYADGTKHIKGYNDALREDTTTITKTEEGQTVTQKSISKRNALGQTIASIDDIGNVVTYSYDAVGRLKSSYVDDNYKTVLKYDLLGNRKSIDDPDAGYVSSDYNAFGQLMSQTNARMQTSAYKYDALGRVDTVKTTEIIDGKITVLDALEYDYISSGSAIGQVNWIKQNNTFAEEYSYDKYGRINGKTEYIDGHTPFTSSNTYDDYGRVEDMTYPGGDFTITNAYNSRGDLRGIVYDGDTIYKNIDFTAMGALTEYNLHNDTYSFSKGYDNFGRLESMVSDFYNLSYTYAPMGNMKSRVNNSLSISEFFTYDDLNRLTDVELVDDGDVLSDYGIAIQYHDNGNIISNSNVSANMEYNHATKPHALTRINAPVDAQTQDQSMNYTYFNKVESITQSSGSYFGLTGGTSYYYDFTYGIDKQRRKTVYSSYNASSPTSTILRTKYYLDNYEKVIEDGVTKEYHYLRTDAGLFGIFVKTDEDDGELKYVLTDHLGSFTGVVDATTGKSENEVSYDAWGDLRSSDWKSDFTGSLFADRGFTGHEHLPSVFGLIDMNGRMYDPKLGRFLSPDPYVQSAGNSQSFNRYSYCLNNPLMFTDPSGYMNNPLKWMKEKWDDAWDGLDQFAKWADNTPWFPSTGGAGINVNSDMQVGGRVELGGVTVYDSYEVALYQASRGCEENVKVAMEAYYTAAAAIEYEKSLDASSSGGNGNDGVITGFTSYGLYRFDEAGLSLQYLNKSNKLKFYKDWSYGNRYTTNTKIATRGNALLFGI
nr:hypothetical protein [Bacteroidales bacterium]